MFIIIFLFLLIYKNSEFNNWKDFIYSAFHFDKTLEGHYVMERRKGDNPVPDNLDEYLNDLQMQALQRLESMGYNLKFVRRPLFLDVIAVVSNPQNHKIAMLKVDGSIDFFPDIQLRDWDSENTIPELKQIAGRSKVLMTIDTRSSTKSKG